MLLSHELNVVCSSKAKWRWFQCASWYVLDTRSQCFVNVVTAFRDHFNFIWDNNGKISSSYLFSSLKLMQGK